MLKLIFNERFSVFDFIVISCVIDYINDDPGVFSVIVGSAIILISIFAGSVGKAIAESRMK